MGRRRRRRESLFLVPSPAPPCAPEPSAQPHLPWTPPGRSCCLRGCCGSQAQGSLVSGCSSCLCLRRAGELWLSWAGGAGDPEGPPWALPGAVRGLSLLFPCPPGFPGRTFGAPPSLRWLQSPRPLSPGGRRPPEGLGSVRVCWDAEPWVRGAGGPGQEAASLWLCRAALGHGN